MIMGATWLPILLLAIIFIPPIDTQIERTMRHSCFGSTNGRADVYSPDRYNDLRMIYQNCTRVFGNIEITFLNEENVGNRTLDFLDDIEEVKGYILLFRVEVKRISFKKLKIVWGDDLFQGMAGIIVDNSTRLEVLSMPNLRTVANGIVNVEKSKKMCYMKKPNYDEILDFKNRTLFFHLDSCSKKRLSCHPSCSGHCWGPGEDDCQSIYRSICPDDCESRQCYFDALTNQTRCCNSQCVGGCFGPTSKECNLCTNFIQCTDIDKPSKECRCVEQCTSMKKYNRKTGQVERNPDGFYSMDNRYCEKECPEGRLYQDDVCVEHCGEGMHYDPNKGDRICRKCDGPCPKSCKFEKVLNSRSLQELQNCTEIEGYLKISKETFTDHYIFGDKTNNTIPAVTVPELDVLKSVRFISEYVFIAADQVRSLSFLENLEVIEGRSLFQTKQALIISSNGNLQHLGLRKLKKIAKGDVIISANFELCFINSINWKDISVGANRTVSIKQNRPQDQCTEDGLVCHAACDPAFGCWGPSNKDCRKCNHWRQDDRCVDKCSLDAGFFENKDNKTCERCYAECQECKGPEPTDCTKCRSHKLFLKKGQSSFELEEEDEEAAKPISHLLDIDRTSGGENGLPPYEQPSPYTQLTCVHECPNARFYLDKEKVEDEKGECKRCHKSCYDMGCTGPSDVPGAGGCNKCKYAQIEMTDKNSVGTVSRCLYNKDKSHSNTVCINNNLHDHFVQSSTHDSVQEFECAQCDDECSSCTSKGSSRINNGCMCKNFVSFQRYHKFANPKDENKRIDEKCVPSCTWGLYHDNSTTLPGVAGVCRACHEFCERTGHGPHCYGSTESDCVKCGSSYFSVMDGGTLKKCVKNCTTEDLFTYYKDKTCNKEDLETRDRIRHAALYIIAAIFLLAVLIIGCLLWRRQRRLSKELEQEKAANLPELPELIPMDLANVRPNMERLTLIPKHALSRSGKELGRGAFGVVYAGCWMPKTGSAKITKVPVAIKVVRDPSGKAQSEMLDEATKMTMLRHENLLRIVGVCLSGEDLQLVTLLRPLGNLREFLQKHKGKLSGKELLQYSYQIASGMKYLTDHRVVHRDLAARNVLVKNIHHVEITDFGLAKLIDIGSDSVQVGEGKVAIKWLALEALEKQVYNTATDVWAFGVTVWEALTYGESPYASKSPMAIKEMLLNGERLAQPNNCSTELYKVLIDCWLPNPDSRPTFALIKDLLYRYCRAPHMFVYDIDSNVSPSDMDNLSQMGLIEDILDDTGLEDPQNYFDSEPNTPGCQTSGDMFNNMGIRRMDSLGSQRYAQDPVTGRKEFGIVDDNYLVPNSQTAEIGAIMYTPVVVDESGNSSLVESHGYYNEVKPGAEYINETQPMKKNLRNSRDDRLVTIEEGDSYIEKESCL